MEQIAETLFSPDQVRTAIIFLLICAIIYYLIVVFLPLIIILLSFRQPVEVTHV